MVKNSFVVVLVFVILFGLFSSTSAKPIAKVVTGVVSNAVSAFLKWLWSLKSTTKPSNQFSVKHSRSMMKFEIGYTVETIFDGSKLGIEPYSVEVSSNGEFLVLDSENSNIYRIPSPVSTYSKPKILAGSPEGYTGHIDGRPREARMNHPKGIAVDDRGNVYIADTMNMAIRKISDEGVTTIAGGKRGQIGGHVDGAGEDAKFSNDFDVVYAASSCSLLVVDRGNLAIREIQLHHHDCTTYRHQQDEDDEDDVSFPLGIAVLVAAGFFGYMLALLHWKVKAMFSSPDDPRAYSIRKGMPVATAQQRPPPMSVRPPLIPNEEEYEKEDEGFFGSIGRLFVYSGSAFVEIFGSLFSGSCRSKRKALHYHQYQQQMMNRHHNTWPVQESFVIPDEDEPPPPPCLETRTSKPRESHPYMNQKEREKPHQQHRGAYLSGRWDGEYDQQIQQQGKQQLVQKHYSSQSYYDQNCEANEIVFGAVQEQDGRRETMVIKAVDYGDPKYNHSNLRPRLNYVGYSQGY
ncbi:hypothetical protein QN277_013821 [Acacia crassicarpa]|uniref:Teneurin NHL domain-containing protein n=1 Tax=Acacia crassicarpa TaxID=499986 RepID=A0AAE1N379_9FABA|nr:hypothetical protein QN277_013821 [Acacia crassicarpa]